MKRILERDFLGEVLSWGWGSGWRECRGRKRGDRNCDGNGQGALEC